MYEKLKSQKTWFYKKSSKVTKCIRNLFIQSVFWGVFLEIKIQDFFSLIQSENNQIAKIRLVLTQFDDPSLTFFFFESDYLNKYPFKLKTENS